MSNLNVKSIALCGILAAVAVVIMCFGGLIPIATYSCPMLCTLICNVVLLSCGQRMAWTWYVAVCVLSLLLGPDREAATLFVFLGSYPCVKIHIDKLWLGLLWKILYLNAVTITSTLISIYILGLPDLKEEFSVLAFTGILVAIILANVTFLLLDILLNRMNTLYRNKKR